MRMVFCFSIYKIAFCVLNVAALLEKTCALARERAVVSSGGYLYSLVFLSVVLMGFVVTLPDGLLFAEYDLKVQTGNELVEYMKNGRVILSSNGGRHISDSGLSEYDWQFSFGFEGGGGVVLPAVVQKNVRTEQLGVGIVLLAAMAVVNQPFLNSEFAKVANALRK